MNDPITLQAESDATIELYRDALRKKARDMAALKEELSKAEYREYDLGVLLKNEAENYRREAEDNARLRAIVAGYQSANTIPAPALSEVA